MSNTSLPVVKKLVYGLQRIGSPFFKPSKKQKALALLFAFHIVGVLGAQVQVLDDLLHQFTPFESFLSLTPLNLIVTCLLLVLFFKEWNKAFYVFLVACFSVGFFVEMLGVNTGIIFGEYSYGTVLGAKIWDTPPLIGVNWLILVGAVGSVVAPWRLHILIKSLLVALFMTGLDFLIEPVAMHFGFWYWENDIVPIQNYIAWFFISFVLGLLFFNLKFEKKNEIALYVFIVQVLFFAVNFLLL